MSREISLFLSLFLACCFFITLSLVWVFEYIFNYLPCTLCYQQRIPYYSALPIMLLVSLFFYIDKMNLARFFLWVVLGVMCGSVFLSFRHVAIENDWWSYACTFTSPTSSPGSLSLEQSLGDLSALDCGGGVEKILGLSFASWNALVSVFYVLCIVCMLQKFLVYRERR